MKCESTATGKKNIYGVHINKLAAYFGCINLQEKTTNLKKLKTQEKNALDVV